MSSLPEITGYHAHVYFNVATVEQARSLCEQAAQRFDLVMGRVHTRPVGPHPQWSCQLAFAPEVFAELIPWLLLARNGLDVFVHPQTDCELRDHRDCALWLGQSHTLDLSVFRQR